MPSLDERIEEWLELNNSDKQWSYDAPGSLVTMAEEIFCDIQAERATPTPDKENFEAGWLAGAAYRDGCEEGARWVLEYDTDEQAIAGCWKEYKK